MSNLPGLMSTAMMRAALAIFAPDDRRQADTAQAEDGNGSALFHLGGIQHGADPGGDAATKQADLIQRRVLGIFAGRFPAARCIRRKVKQPM